MSKRETDAVAKILTDPENVKRSAEEVAALVLEQVYDLAVSAAKAEIRAETRSEIRRQIFERDSAVRRLAVVGQISFGPQEETHTVVLGPFYAPHKLSTEEKFREAVAKPCTPARDAGRHLAWDYKTGRERGRFMLAPAFMKPNEAWDFFRPDRRPSVQHITEAIAEWRPGLWAEQEPAEPGCACGLKGDLTCRVCGNSVKRHCPRHQPEAEIHRCRKAA